MANKALLVAALLACALLTVSAWSSPSSLLEVSADAATVSKLAGVQAAALAEAADALDEADFAENEAQAFVEQEANEEAIQEHMQEAAMLEMEQEPEAAATEAGANPTYMLPYPPIVPGHYTPLFNPYTNLNPLSTPFANYAATPGAHPGVAAAAAAQAGSLASLNAQALGAHPVAAAVAAQHATANHLAAVNAAAAATIPFAAGGYPYVPYTRDAVVAANLQGNPVPFTGSAGWVHPLNMNSAAVGENAEAESLGQFLEVTSTEETEHAGCVGCEY